MTATYDVQVKTPESTIRQKGTLRSPDHYGVLCCVLAGQLSDDHKLLKAAPELLEIVQICLKAERERKKKLLPSAPASTYTQSRIDRIEAVLAKLN